MFTQARACRAGEEGRRVFEGIAQAQYAEAKRVHCYSMLDNTRRPSRMPFRSLHYRASPTSPSAPSSGLWGERSPPCTTSLTRRHAARRMTLHLACSLIKIVSDIIDRRHGSKRCNQQLCDNLLEIRTNMQKASLQIYCTTMYQQTTLTLAP
jgi:hypothetical protein